MLIISVKQATTLRGEACLIVPIIVQLCYVAAKRAIVLRKQHLSSEAHFSIAD